MASDTSGSGSLTIHPVPIWGNWIGLMIRCPLCGACRTHYYRPDTAVALACTCGRLYMLGWQFQLAPFHAAVPN